ncbi:MAG: vitamin B12 dependent methionine synthase [Clostridiales bacterium]|nr:vitamin B12 dependent methionine synthase [Clostridiales bacterium]
MKQIILDKISFKLDRNQLFKKLHVDPDSDDGKQLTIMIQHAELIGKPKVLYTLSSINSLNDECVTVDSVKLSSRVMQVNFAEINRVFPYVVTCGRELYEWAGNIEDMLEQYWADIIMEQALTIALKYFHIHMQEEYRLGKFKAMNPGSLEDWPISQQRELFQILGNAREAIGVELTDSYLMLPVKSTSGILFQTESNYENCQLCPREDCSNRRAKYNTELYEEKYKILPHHSM